MLIRAQPGRSRVGAITGRSGLADYPATGRRVIAPVDRPDQQSPRLTAPITGQGGCGAVDIAYRKVISGDSGGVSMNLRWEFIRLRAFWGFLVFRDAEMRNCMKLYIST